MLSVNVGLPHDVTWNGRTVRTSVWKSPVTGRRMVRTLDIDGDAQADLSGHGGEHRGGSITYNPEPLEMPAPGNALVCCSQPDAGVILDL
ncbi:MAG TPA: hypothetical protein VFF64_28665 [Candidatus Eremiobacteraceae bacterium]|nr:hypothetical protein [Candidatus Eremiobacteraceae bacterium]